jgi:hypothetical protein
MAGDWIKMRAAILQSPKLIAMSRFLNLDAHFWDWLTCGEGAPEHHGTVISDDALRCVTGALLMRVWSAAREFGKANGKDVVLPHLTYDDIDTIAGAPGVGKAMSEVGWARLCEGAGAGVVLPNFFEHNAALTPAEKQRAYRQRSYQARESVTKALPDVGNAPLPNVTPREEKSREENTRGINPPRTPSRRGGGAKKNATGGNADFEVFWAAYPRHTAKAAARKAWDNLAPDDALRLEILRAVESQCRSEQWTREGGRFIPHPATWLNHRRWEDEPPEVLDPGEVNAAELRRQVREQIGAKPLTRADLIAGAPDLYGPGGGCDLTREVGDGGGAEGLDAP